MRILTAAPNYANAQTDQGWSVPQTSDAASALSTLTKVAAGNILDSISLYSSIQVEDITRFFTGFSATSVDTNPRPNPTQSSQTYLFIDEVAGFQSGQTVSILEGYEGNYSPDSFVSERFFPISVGVIPMTDSSTPSQVPYPDTIGNGTPITLTMPVPPETPAKHIQRLYSDYQLSSGYYTSSAWTFTATTDGTTAVLTNVSSTANLVAGQSVSGTGIPTGATIISVDSASQITISANTTASGSTTVTTPNNVVTLPNSDGLNFTVGQTLTDSYANYIGVITAVSSGFLTLSTTPNTNSTTTATQSSTTSLKNAAQITAAVASSDGTLITYTANNKFAAGDVVTILNSSSSSASFNFVNIPVITATSTSFTISGSVSGSLTGWTGIATLGYTQYATSNPYSLYASGSPITVSGATPSSYNYTSTVSTQDYISVRVSTSATITSAVGNGTTITYTAQNSFVAGQTVSIVGLTNDSGSSLNLTNVVIASTDGTKFTVTNSTVGTSNGGGTAYIVSVYGAVSGANLSIVDYSHEIAATSLGYEATYTRGYIDSTGFINTPTTTNNMQVGDYVLDTTFTNIGQVTASAVTGASFTSQFQNPTITGYITASYGSSAHAVTSITAAGGSPNYYATLITGTAHGRLVGDLISFVGVTGYTGFYTVVSVTNTTTLLFSSTSPTTTVGAGGSMINAVTALTVNSTAGIQVGMTFGAISGFFALSTVVGVDSTSSKIYINTGAQAAYTYASPGQAFSITTPSSLQGKLITGAVATGQNPMNLIDGSYTPVLNQTITGTSVPTSTTLVGLPTTANKVTAVLPTYAITSITANASPYRQPWCLVTTSVAHPFFAGQQVTLSGGTYINGTYTISSVPSSTSFNISKTTYGAITTVSSASGGTLGYTWTYTANNNLKAGDHITVTGTTNFNVTDVQVVSATATQFTITRATNPSGGTLTGQWNLATDSSSNLSTGGASVAFAGDTSYFTISNAFTGTLSSNVVLNIADGTSTTVDTDGGIHIPTSSTLLVFQSSGFPYFILDGTKTGSPSFYGQLIGFPWRGALNTLTPNAYWQAKFTNFAKTPAANLVSATTSQPVGPSTFYVDSTAGILNSTILFRNAIYTVLDRSSSYNIVGASSTGSQVTYTTDGNHSLSSGQFITVSGITPTTLNFSDIAIVSVTSNTFTVASTVTDTYVGGGVVDVAQPYITVSESSPAYSLATTAYPNGDYAQNSFFNYESYSNTIAEGCMLTDTQYQGTGLGSLYSTAFEFSNKHVAGTAVGGWLTGNRYFGSNTTGDLETVSPTWLGSLTGGTLFSDLVAQSSQAFIVSPAATSNSTYSNSGTITPISNFVNFSVSGYGNNVVIVGEGETQEAVVISGAYSTIDGSDITQANAGAVLWALAEGQSFQYNHSAGEPVVLPNVIGSFSNAHGKNAPVLSGADNGTVAENGVLTAGALVASNPSGKTNIIANASMNFTQPWYQSGVSGQPNINTTLTYSATVGSGSVTIDDANDFPTAYPSVYNQNDDTTEPAIGFFLGSFGRVAGNTPVGSTSISVAVSAGFQTPIAISGTSNFQIVINGDTLTCTSFSTGTSSLVFYLASATSNAYSDLSPVSLPFMDVSSTVTSLSVPYFYPTTAITIGNPITSLTTTPTPIPLTEGLNLYIAYNTTYASVTVAQDVPAGSTTIPIQYFKPSHNFPAVVGSNGVITTYNSFITVGLNIPLNQNDVILLTSGDGTTTQPVVVDGYSPEVVTSFPVKPFNPNYAYDNTAQIQYLYPLVLDSGAVQEIVYPVALPTSTSNVAAQTPPFTLPLAYPTVYAHSAGATLQWFEYPTNPAVGDVTYRPDLDKFYIFDGNGWQYARVHNVQNIYSVLGAVSSSYKDKEIFTLVDSATGAVGTADSFSNNSPASYTVNVGNVSLTDPNGNEWTASALQNILLNAQVTVPQSTSVALRAIAMQITFRGGPSVGGIYLSPSDILQISDNTNPYVGWIFSDVEGDTQTGWDVRIFSDAVKNGYGFSPDTSTPIWEKSANNDASSTFLTSDGFTSSARWISGEYYWVYIRVSKDFHQSPWWSDWNSTYFAAIVSQPQQPLVTAFTDNINAVNKLVIQSSDNLLGDNNADFKSSTGGWYVRSSSQGGGDTASSSIYIGQTATNSRSAFTENQLVTSIPVGSIGYVSNVGALSTTTGTGTFSVSSVNGSTVKATGFPIGSTSPTSAPFWVTVQNADGTNAEQILVKNLSDGSATKADTFKVILRNYNYSTNTGGTGLTHAKWSQVVYGLQEPIYTGSSGILSFTYDTTALGTSVYKIVEPATGGTYSTTVSNSYKIVEGNKNHLQYVFIDDPNDSLPVGSNQSLDCQIQYSSWTIPAGQSYYTFSGNNIVYQNIKAKQTTPTSTQAAEPAKITAVQAAMTSGGNDLRIGYLQHDLACGIDQHTGKLKNIVALTIQVTNSNLTANSMSAVTPAGQRLWEYGWRKGDIFKVFGNVKNPDGSTSSKTFACYFVVASNFNSNANNFSGPSFDSVGDTVSVWRIPVLPVSVIPQATIAGTKMALMPQGSLVHYVQPPHHASRKKVVFDKPLNQGQWAGQTVQNGDKLQFTSTKVVGGSAAQGEWFTPKITTSHKTYQTFYVGMSQYTANYYSAVIPSDPYTTLSIPIGTTSFTGTITNGSTSVTNISKSLISGLAIGMKISGTGIPSGATITAFDLTNYKLTMSAKATASGTPTISTSVASNAYQNWVITGDGIPAGAYVVSNTASSGGSFTVTLSNSCQQSAVGYNGSTGSFILGSTVDVSLYSPTANKIPAGSTSIPVSPFYANFNYDAYCPIVITNHSIFGQNTMTIDPSASGTNTAEVSLAPYSWNSWTASNSIPVFAGNTYGFGGFSKFLEGTRVPSTAGVSTPDYPYFTPYIDWYDSNGNLIAVSNGTRSLTKPLITGNITSGSNQLSNVSPIANVAVNQVISGIGIPSGTTVSSISGTTITMSANATASLSNINVYVHNNFTAGTKLNPVQDAATVLTDTTNVWGQGWCPAFIVATAPLNHVLAYAATTSSVTSSTAQLNFSVGVAHPIAAGTPLTFNGNFQVTTTTLTAQGATTMAVRFTAGTIPPSVGNITTSATYACPRIQWTNALSTDVYSLSAVMFKAMTAPSLTTDYSPLNSSLTPLLSSATIAATNPANNSALTISSNTPTLGEASIYVIDPVNDAGTREIHYGSGNSSLWTTTSAAANAGDTQIILNSVEGLAANASLTLDFGSSVVEYVNISSTWNGSATVTLSAPLWNNHAKGVQVYAATAGISDQVRQNQNVGTNVAVFNWNTDGWVNTSNSHTSYKVLIERSEDQGQTWQALRGGSQLTVGSSGYVTLTDYEAIPNQTTLYRATPTYTTPAGNGIVGIASAGLKANTISNNSWWIASTSDDSIRFELNVLDQLEENQRHPAGTFYPLGSPYPITVPGVVTGRDGSLKVMWTDPDTWDSFLSFLKRGEIFILLNPVENERRYIFVNQDVQVVHHAAVRPYREVTIPFVESAPPTYTYVN
jgi:hypothetical protein